MKVYVPSNLDLESLLKSKGLDKYCRPMHLDKFYYLIHIIYEQRILYKDQDLIKLKAKYLQFIIKDYNIYRNILVDLNVIECDYHYIKGKKSFGHKILPPYSEVPTKKIALQAGRVTKRVNIWNKNKLPVTPIHQRLYYFLSKTKIDHEALDKLSNFSVEKQNIYKISIEKFLNKDFFMYNDDYGRIHTNISNLKSYFRRFLSYNGMRLASIDLKNSQPLLFYILYTQETGYRNRINTYMNTFLNPIEDVYAIRYPLLEVEEEEEKRYREAVEQGYLYEMIAEMVPEVETREEAKKYIFRDILFGRKVCKYFRREFPKISDYLISLKKKDYRRVAWAMQRLESKIIIQGACGRLVNRFPEAYLATIHDSILTTPEHAIGVQEAILEVFMEYGIKPTFTIESY